MTGSKHRYMLPALPWTSWQSKVNLTRYVIGRFVLPVPSRRHLYPYRYPTCASISLYNPFAEGRKPSPPNYHRHSPPWLSCLWKYGFTKPELCMAESRTFHLAAMKIPSSTNRVPHSGPVGIAHSLVDTHLGLLMLGKPTQRTVSSATASNDRGSSPRLRESIPQVAGH